MPDSKSVGDPLLAIRNALSADGRHLPCDFVEIARVYTSQKLGQCPLAKTTLAQRTGCEY